MMQVGGMEILYVILAGQFWEKVEYPLDEGRKSYGVKTILDGDLTLEDTMEHLH